ncbi:MAG: GatB/YqeY domain-containing protein [Thermoleophilia bacterium]|nr:GatB/YqeY domain-containing protein [Thermoleophilia bacterium]
MSVIEQIQNDLSVAMKSRDKAYISTLRMILSAMQMAQKEEKRSMTSEQEVAVLARERKRRMQAADAFRRVGRDERALMEEAEAKVIESYLPPPGMTDVELDMIIDEVVAETGAVSIRDMGTVMGRVMPRVGHRLEGSIVGERVKNRLLGGGNQR